MIKKFIMAATLGLFLMAAAGPFTAASAAEVKKSAGQSAKLRDYQLKDGQVYRKGVALDCEVNEVPPEIKGSLRFWSVFEPTSGQGSLESETGLWFFSKEGAALTFAPLDSVYELQEVIVSPDGGHFILGLGSGARLDLTYEVHGGGAGKIARFGGIQGDIQWIDPRRFVFTRVDKEIREGASFLNLSYGLRLSVVAYDVAIKQTTFLRESSATKNYSLLEVTSDGDSASVREEYVKLEEDWADKKKIKKRVIKVKIPAAG
jgi:hypothetical protein